MSLSLLLLLATVVLAQLVLAVAQYLLMRHIGLVNHRVTLLYELVEAQDRLRRKEVAP